MIYNRRIGCVCSVWLLAACRAPSEGSDDPGQDVGPGGAGNSVLPPATTAGGGTSNGGGTGLIDETPGVEGNVPPVGGVTASGNVPCDVATIVRAIRSGKAAEGVCQVIGALSEKLAELAPVRADDTNELPDRVR